MLLSSCSVLNTISAFLLLHPLLHSSTQSQPCQTRAFPPRRQAKSHPHAELNWGAEFGVFLHPIQPDRPQRSPLPRGLSPASFACRVAECRAVPPSKDHVWCLARSLNPALGLWMFSLTSFSGCSSCTSPPSPFARHSGSFSVSTSTIFPAGRDNQDTGKVGASSLQPMLPIPSWSRLTCGQCCKTSPCTEVYKVLRGVRLRLDWSSHHLHCLLRRCRRDIPRSYPPCRLWQVLALTIFSRFSCRREGLCLKGISTLTTDTVGIS